MKSLFLEAPPGEIDSCVMPLITKWSDPPKPIEILEVLDQIIYGALSTNFVVSVLQVYLDTRLKEENQTFEDIEPFASWRKKQL